MSAPSPWRDTIWPDPDEEPGQCNAYYLDKPLYDDDGRLLDWVQTGDGQGNGSYNDSKSGTGNKIDSRKTGGGGRTYISQEHRNIGLGRQPGVFFVRVSDFMGTLERLRALVE